MPIVQPERAEFRALSEATGAAPRPAAGLIEITAAATHRLRVSTDRAELRSSVMSAPSRGTK